MLVGDTNYVRDEVVEQEDNIKASGGDTRQDGQLRAGDCIAA